MEEPYIGMIVEGGAGSNQPHGTTIRQCPDGKWRVVAVPKGGPLRDRHGRFAPSPIALQKYLARAAVAVVIVALACAFTWASAWMWP
jgi:hypothetical protein